MIFIHISLSIELPYTINFLVIHAEIVKLCNIVCPKDKHPSKENFFNAVVKIQYKKKKFRILFFIFYSLINLNQISAIHLYRIRFMGKTVKLKTIPDRRQMHFYFVSSQFSDLCNGKCFMSQLFGYKTFFLFLLSLLLYSTQSFSENRLVADMTN
jgi:hypothetical protein